ncbi:protein DETOXIFICATION 41 [Cryptomeria japonica]|uniref:protein DETOXIFICATION 41 n=1 Tax=Cryptomeria japonica TaxID=3369 RepID=UPI0025AB8014|nr:protein DETOXIFICATION 41 [Cryptomeria japonica]
MSEINTHITNSPAEDRIEWPNASRRVLSELKKLCLLSGPAVLVMLFNFLLSVVSQMFAGHLGELQLAGACIANVGIQGFAYGVLIGMSSAVQTVCGQAFGAKKYKMLGIICQQSMLLMTATAMLLSFLYIFAEPALHAIGQNKAIAAQGAIFARGLIPQLFAFALSCPLQRFLLSQNIVAPLAYISVAIFLLHVLLSWLAIYKLGLGLLGASLTLSLSWWILTIATFLYILWSPSCKDTWSGFSWKAFTGLWPFFKLSMASAIMLCLEIWYNQSLVLISGLLPNPEVALDSLSICMNYWNWDMQLMLGISAAACTRVGNELGARRAKAASFSVVVVVSTSIIISVFLAIVILALHKYLGHPFTSSTEVTRAVSSMTPLLAISVFLNGAQPVLSGVAVGCGWQKFVAYVNLFSYYIVGLPAGIMLGFVAKSGAKGIWWGMIIGVGLQTLILIIFTARTNWNKEVEGGVKRLERSRKEPSGEEGEVASST